MRLVCLALIAFFVVATPLRTIRAKEEQIPPGFACPLPTSPRLPEPPLGQRLPLYETDLRSVPIRQGFHKSAGAVLAFIIHHQDLESRIVRCGQGRNTTSDV